MIEEIIETLKETRLFDFREDSNSPFEYIKFNVNPYGLNVEAGNYGEKPEQLTVDPKEIMEKYLELSGRIYFKVLDEEIKSENLDCKFWKVDGSITIVNLKTLERTEFVQCAAQKDGKYIIYLSVNRKEPTVLIVSEDSVRFHPDFGKGFIYRGRFDRVFSLDEIRELVRVRDEGFIDEVQSIMNKCPSGSYTPVLVNQVISGILYLAKRDGKVNLTGGKAIRDLMKKLEFIRVGGMDSYVMDIILSSVNKEKSLNEIIDDIEWRMDFIDDNGNKIDLRKDLENTKVDLLFRKKSHD
jgi:hypothetical protein